MKLMAIATGAVIITLAVIGACTIGYVNEVASTLRAIEAPIKASSAVVTFIIGAFCVWLASFGW
jgi:hypothetical protein